MAYLIGSFSVNGLPRNGATVNLYDVSSFPTPPKSGDALPTSGILQTAQTSATYGGDGSYRFSVGTNGEWWVGISWNGFTTFEYHLLQGSPTFKTVKDFGAIGDGVTNDTAAFNSAIAAVSGTGGDVIVPPGTYAVNLTLISDNVRLLGTSMTLDANSGNRLVPFASGSPVVTVGDDNAGARRSDIRMESLTLDAAGPNGTGTDGLVLAGGTQRFNGRNLAAHGFTAHCLKIQGGTHQPAQLSWFEQCQFQPANVCTGAGVLVAYPFSGAEWTTDIFFTDCQFYSPATSGYALEVDSAQIFVLNCFVNALNNHGVKLTNTVVSNTPIINCFSLIVDSGNPADVVVTGYNASLFIGSFLNGVFSVKGLLANNAAATTAVPYAGCIGDKLCLSSAYAVGGLSFGSTSQAYNTNHEILASTNFQFVSSGHIQFQHGTAKVCSVQDAVSGLPGTFDTGILRLNNNQWKEFSGSGSPEGSITSTVGSIYHQVDGDTGRLTWVKATGTGNTGWRPITEHIPVRTTSGTPYTCAIDDQVVCVNVAGAATVNLPASPSLGRIVTVKDLSGGASGNNITVQGNGANIDGASSSVISTNYGKLTVVYNGTTWSVIA